MLRKRCPFLRLKPTVRLGFVWKWSGLSWYQFYIYIYLSLSLSTNLSYLVAARTFPFMAAKIFEPASSHDLLGVAGHSSLTSSTRHSWLGKMSDTLTCIHFRYTPEGYYPYPQGPQWKGAEAGKPFVWEQFAKTLDDGLLGQAANLPRQTLWNAHFALRVGSEDHSTVGWLPCNGFPWSIADSKATIRQGKRHV